MSNIKTLPDLGKAFRMMKVKDELMKIPPVTLFGTAVRWAVENKPISQVCHLVLTQYKDDPKDVLHVVGQETIDLIKSIYE